MGNRLTPNQFRTLEIIGGYPSGQTMLLPMYWRDRHHQALLRRGLLRVRADPFKTKAHMLRGSITKRGRDAVRGTSQAVRAQAKVDAERDYEKYVREIEEGRA